MWILSYNVLVTKCLYMLDMPSGKREVTKVVLLLSFKTPFLYLLTATLHTDLFTVPRPLHSRGGVPASTGWRDGTLHHLQQARSNVQEQR